MNYVGDCSPGSTIQIYFSTFDSNDPSASSALTTVVAATDVHIFKNGNTTPRTNAAGITVDLDVNGMAGTNLISIDLSDNTVADPVTAGHPFFAAGNDYGVAIEGGTLDGGNITAFVGHFSIDNRNVAGRLHATVLSAVGSQTSVTLDTGSAIADAYNNCVMVITSRVTGLTKAIAFISDYDVTTKVVTLAAAPVGHTMVIGDSVSIIATSALANVTYWNEAAAPTIATESSLVDAVLDETLSTNHETPDTLGLAAHDLIDGNRIDLLIDAIKAVTDVLAVPQATGTADSGTTLTCVDTERTEADTDFWKDCLIQFTDGTLQGQTRRITGFTPASDTITFFPATTTAVSTHTYTIFPGAAANTQWINDTPIVGDGASPKFGV